MVSFSHLSLLLAQAVPEADTWTTAFSTRQKLAIVGAGAGRIVRPGHAAGQAGCACPTTAPKSAWCWPRCLPAS